VVGSIGAPGGAAGMAGVLAGAGCWEGGCGSAGRVPVAVVVGPEPGNGLGTGTAGVCAAAARLDRLKTKASVRNPVSATMAPHYRAGFDAE